MATVIGGIFQGDIVLRTAVITALRELRENPELIDDALASLPQDDLTKDVYGEKTISGCKEWFIKTQTQVKLGISLTHLGNAPAVIAIEMGTNGEGEATLGDVHHQPSEPDPANPTKRRRLASVAANETYTIAIFGIGEPEYILFLYTLVLFGLLRCKDELLAARGFDISSFNCGVVGKLEHPGMEHLYMRSIQVSGKVRHSWPVKGTESGVIEEVYVATTAGRLATPDPSDDKPFDPEAWADQDMLTGAITR